jgi:hypothetical protein
MELALVALRESASHLTKLYETESQRVKELGVSLLKEQQAVADIERAQSIHDTTAKQLRLLEFADQALANGQVSMTTRMIEAPDASAKLVWPRPLQFISLCASFGFAMGCVLVTVAERVTRMR